MHCLRRFSPYFAQTLASCRASRRDQLKVGRVLVVVSVVGLSAPAVGQGATDDDVVRLNGASWRLHGVDLPDPDQVCTDGWRAGEMSRAALRRLTEGAKVECKHTVKDHYGRPAASCSINGEDLGATLVRQGMAWASLRYTWRYVVDDWVAWFNSVGVHAHPCDKPWEWRARNRAGR